MSMFKIITNKGTYFKDTQVSATKQRTVDIPSNERVVALDFYTYNGVAIGVHIFTVNLNDFAPEQVAAYNRN